MKRMLMLVMVVTNVSLFSDDLINNVPINAYATATGVTGILSGAGALAFNPAAIAVGEDVDLELVTGIRSQYFGAYLGEINVSKKLNVGVFGFGASGFWFNYDVYDTVTNETRFGSEGFGSYTTVRIALAYAYPLNKNSIVGISTKGVVPNTFGYSGFDLLFDVGFIYKFTENMRIGGALTNLGGVIKPMYEARYATPITFRISFVSEWLNDNFITGVDLTFPKEGSPGFGCGISWRLADVMSIRCGFTYAKDLYEYLHAGMEINLPTMGLSYGIAPHKTLGLAHNISLRYVPQPLEVTPAVATVEETRKDRLAAQMLFRTAETYFNEGRYEDCMRNCDLALIYDPTLEDARELIHRASVALKQREIREYIISCLLYTSPSPRD